VEGHWCLCRVLKAGGGTSTEQLLHAFQSPHGATPAALSAWPPATESCASWRLQPCTGKDRCWFCINGAVHAPSTVASGASTSSGSGTIMSDGSVQDRRRRAERRPRLRHLMWSVAPDHRKPPELRCPRISGSYSSAAARTKHQQLMVLPRSSVLRTRHSGPEGFVCAMRTAAPATRATRQTGLVHRFRRLHATPVPRLRDVKG
jgi:hypothetical protein